MAGYRIPGGMVYVGQNLPGLSRWRAPIEPSLIDPHLRVDRDYPDRSGHDMPYWPSYSRISAASRAGYLEWLAGGRKAPDAAIGYVFLFFYGLERRLLADARDLESARTERPALIAEIERLLELYGATSESFHGYASRLLTTLRVLGGGLDPLRHEPTPDHHGGSNLLEMEIALGTLSKTGEAIPPRWALAWVSQIGSFNLRTPARRCRSEFDELFLLRYAERFRNGGLRIKPNKTRLRIHYYPASPTFDHSSRDLEVPDLPDVMILKAPARKLQEVIDAVCDELDAYSRCIGRGVEPESPAAVALLPRELGARREADRDRPIWRWIDERLAEEAGPVAVVETERLAELWGVEGRTKLTTKESQILARFLATRGIGIEPDPRFGTPALRAVEQAVLFRSVGLLPEEHSPAYWTASLLMHLPVLVSAADGEVSPAEERHLLDHVEEGLQLDPVERQRLEAHVRRLLTAPPSIAGLKKKLEFVDEEHRHAMGRFLLSVAGADGRIDSEEIEMLRKVYPLLGLDAEQVFSDVHGLMSGGDPEGKQPAAARAGEEVPVGETVAATATPIRLDLDRIAKTRDRTEEVGELLRDIFDDAPEEPIVEPEAPAAPLLPDEALVGGLDSSHSALLLRLGSRESWQREEIQRMAGGLGLLPDGALETINLAACEMCGDPLLEESDLVHVDREIFQEMTA